MKITKLGKKSQLFSIEDRIRLDFPLLAKTLARMWPMVQKVIDLVLDTFVNL